MKLIRRWSIAILVIVGLLLSACGPTSTTKEKVQPSRLEPIEGTNLSRVLLTEKAAERLGIQTAPVREEQILQKLTIGGQVIAASDSSGTISASDASVVTAGKKGAVMMRVLLNENDLNKVDRSQPALVRPLDDGEDFDRETEGWMAEPDEGPADDNPEEDALYYVVDDAKHGLAPGQGVMVELTLSGDATQRGVIPYAAVLYDPQGKTWTYTNPGPLTFVREPITVDRIEGDKAFLSDGPAPGTLVVTVGAAELFGAETGVSK